MNTVHIAVVILSGWIATLFLWHIARMAKEGQEKPEAQPPKPAPPPPPKRHERFPWLDVDGTFIGYDRDEWPDIYTSWDNTTRNKFWEDDAKENNRRKAKEREALPYYDRKLWRVGDLINAGMMKAEIYSLKGSVIIKIVEVMPSSGTRGIEVGNLESLNEYSNYENVSCKLRLLNDNKTVPTGCNP
jgi:hypothetical protein